MLVRQCVVAGQFYPGSAGECRAEVKACLAQAASLSTSREYRQAFQRIQGGIVPHAGWMCSGAVAAGAFEVLATDTSIETYVLFGAVHRLLSPLGAVYAGSAWRSPLGEVAVDQTLAEAALQGSSLLTYDPDSHDLEHSIEVQIPFVQHLAPSAKILPIMVPPVASAHEIGRAVAEQVDRLGRKAVFVGSSDLTHYGPRYHFTPKGSGAAALHWAKDVNDRRLIDKILRLEADQIVGEAMTHHNACGSGAIAATLAACVQMGADHAELLQHTTSCEVLAERLGHSTDAVGYAGIIVGRSAS
ncbi:MAG: AmmeMemoRadiSam system protein B [Phycisphaerales bacterium]|nr:AmmeMemoRadiSam system protein B [Phycisphaerales bacterium]